MLHEYKFKCICAFLKSNSLIVFRRVEIIYRLIVPQTFICMFDKSSVLHIPYGNMFLVLFIFLLICSFDYVWLEDIT